MVDLFCKPAEVRGREVEVVRPRRVGILEDKESALLCLGDQRSLTITGSAGVGDGML